MIPKIQLSKLHLSGFRGFEQTISIGFDQQLTVFIGNNGAGKTSVLDAIADGLMYLRNEITGGRLYEYPTPIDPIKKRNYDVNNHAGELENALEIRVNAYIIEEGNYSDDVLADAGFIMRANSSTATKVEEYCEPEGATQIGDLDLFVKDVYGKILEQTVQHLPVLVYYRGGSINTYTEKILIDGTARLTDLFMIDTYKQSLEAKSFSFEQVLLLLDRRQKSMLQERLHGDRFLDALQQATSQLLSDDDGVTYSNFRINYGLLFDEVMIDKTQQNVTTVLYLNQLSSGEKYLLGLVADLVRRLYLANSEGEVLLGEGIVLIDEIELHLHPKWQRKVLTKLLEIFPNVQFVVTTHSPLVLSSIYSEHVRVLDNGKIYGIRNTFGRDANDILDNSMSNDNVSLSSSNYEIIKQIRRLLSEEKIADARHLRNTLQIEGLYAPLLEIDLFIQRRERERINA